MLPKTPHLAIPAEAEIRTTTIDLDFANQHTTRVPYVDPIATPTVHIAEHVAFDTVRGACISVGKDSTIGEEGRIVLPEHGVGVDGSGASIVGVAVAVDEIGVGDVDSFFVGRETKAVRPSETVCHNPDVSCGRVESIDELWEDGLGTESLLVAVYWIREPD